MIKILTFFFALLTLILSGCSSSIRDAQEMLDLDHAKKIEEQELKEEEEAQELLALEAALAEEEASLEEAVKEDNLEESPEASEFAARNPFDIASTDSPQETINPTVPEKNILTELSSMLTNLTNTTKVKQKDETEKTPVEKPAKITVLKLPVDGDNSSKDLPTSGLALGSALKLVACKDVPAKMDAIHRRLLTTKNLNIADRRLRDENNDRLMPVIHFDFDQIIIKSDYQKLLRKQSPCVIKAMKERGDMILQIAGHADERGSDEYNLALGHRRANAVSNSIMAYLPNSKLARIISFGEEFPLDKKSGKSAWDKNRRVEFTFLLKP